MGDLARTALLATGVAAASCALLACASFAVIWLARARDHGPSLAETGRDADDELALMEAYLAGRLDERREHEALRGHVHMHPRDVHPSTWDWTRG